MHGEIRLMPNLRWGEVWGENKGKFTQIQITYETHHQLPYQ